MVEWLTDKFHQLHLTGPDVAVGVAVFVVTLVASFAIVLAVLVRLPADHLCLHRAECAPNTRGPAHEMAWKIARNLLGAVLVVVGLLLSVPGVPGQGLITIIAGILLLDFPGRIALVRRLVGRPVVLHAINRVRAKFGRAPLVID